MELNNKRVLVVGLGKSGVASALFLKAHGARVTVSDTKSGDELRNEIPLLLDHGMRDVEQHLEGYALQNCRLKPGVRCIASQPLRGRPGLWRTTPSA